MLCKLISMKHIKIPDWINQCYKKWTEKWKPEAYAGVWDSRNAAFRTRRLFL